MSKPKFDPSQSFEVVEPGRSAASKPKFDPNAPFEAINREPSQFPVSDLGEDKGMIAEGQPSNINIPNQINAPSILDRAQTQLESFGNAVSLGYLPQIQAAFEKINPDPSGGLDDQLRAQGFTIPKQDYVDLRDENIQRQADQGKRNPYDAMAGSLGGMVVSTPVIGAGAKLLSRGQAAMSGLARLRDSGKVGASLGLVSNPGDEQGVVAPMQSMNRLKNAGTGGALGVAGQGFGETISKASVAVKEAPALFDKIGNITAVKAIGALPRDLKKLFGKNQSHELGDTLLKNGIVTAGDSIEEISKKAGSAKDVTGKQIGEIYQKALDAVTPEKLARMPIKARKLLERTRLDGEDLAEVALAKIEKDLKHDLVDPEIRNKVLGFLKELQAKGKDIDITDLQKIKSNLDKKINYDRSVADMPDLQLQLKTVRDVINKRIQDRVRVLGKITGEKELLTKLKMANREYGHYAKAESIATNRAKEIEGHRWLSLSENIQGGAGATIGAMTGDSPEERFKNAIMGFAAGAALKKSDKFMTPAVAQSAKRLSVILKKPANFAKYTEPLMEAAKKSPEEFQALINQLGKNPEFKLITREAK